MSVAGGDAAVDGEYRAGDDDASSLARKAIAAAISSGWAPRPSGIRFAIAASVSSSSLMSSVISVSVKLGATALTRTPSFAWSIAAARVRFVAPPFAAL